MGFMRRLFGRGPDDASGGEPGPEDEVSDPLGWLAIDGALETRYGDAEASCPCVPDVTTGPTLKA